MSWLDPVMIFTAFWTLATSYRSWKRNISGDSEPKKARPTEVLTVDGLDLEEISRCLEKGIFTSEDLVDLYLSRISQVNDQARAVACINPDAKSIAIKRDQERQNGRVLGPLHGIPFLVKDTFVTLDQMETTGGSFALAGARYEVESTIITKLREAGAVLLGKTNLTVGGFCEDQDPQGSSSGSAIAVSLKLASFAIGGETCGSIIYPAQKSGVVGLKPTVGLTSRAGTIPLNPAQDSVGPLTQYVRDSAVILSIIAGEDELDSATDSIPFNKIPSYETLCQRDALKGIRVAVPRSIYCIEESDPELGAAFRETVSQFRDLGAVIIDDVDFENWKPGSGQREDLCGDILLREAFDEFFAKLVTNPHKIKNISDLIEFTKGTPAEEYEKFGANWFESARDAPGTSASEEFSLVNARLENLGEDIPRLLDEQNCHILLATSSTDLPLDLGRLPGIQIPLGFYSSEQRVIRNSKGMVTKAPNIPYGITLTGRRFSEEKLIACAIGEEYSSTLI
ncbi:amidase [Penicillium malachiteum]|uniref:Amidase n=1 Tax=Penicillium malachiteum TaxID=1324776 RepID=A0AAD6MTN0_9EURO|nr:amidase [Penicillium malachiteum]